MLLFQRGIEIKGFVSNCRWSKEISQSAGLLGCYRVLSFFFLECYHLEQLCHDRNISVSFQYRSTYTVRRSRIKRTDIFQVFDFELSSGDMSSLEALDCGKEGKMFTVDDAKRYCVSNNNCQQRVDTSDLFALLRIKLKVKAAPPCVTRGLGVNVVKGVQSVGVMEWEKDLLRLFFFFLSDTPSTHTTFHSRGLVVGRVRTSWWAIEDLLDD